MLMVHNLAPTTDTWAGCEAGAEMDMTITGIRVSRGVE